MSENNIPSVAGVEVDDDIRVYELIDIDYLFW